MKVIMVLWLLIPWPNHAPTFHETQIEFASYSDCMRSIEHMYLVVKLRYPEGSQAVGFCYP